MAKFVVDGKTYDHDPSKFTFAEGRAVEKMTGHTFGEIEGDPKVAGSIDVLQALLWVSMKRVEPTLKFDDLDDLDMGAVLASFTGDEVRAEPDPTQATVPVAPTSEDKPEAAAPDQTSNFSD